MNATSQRSEVRSRRRPQPLSAHAALLGAVVLLGLAGCSAPGSSPPVPQVTIAPGTSPVTEGTAVQFTLQVAPAPAQDLAVSVTVTDAGARLVAAAPQTVTIPASATAAMLTLPTTADAEVEPDSAVTASRRRGDRLRPRHPELGDGDRDRPAAAAVHARAGGDHCSGSERGSRGRGGSVRADRGAGSGGGAGGERDGDRERCHAGAAGAAAGDVRGRRGQRDAHPAHGRRCRGGARQHGDRHRDGGQRLHARRRHGVRQRAGDRRRPAAAAAAAGGDDRGRRGPGHRGNAGAVHGERGPDASRGPRREPRGHWRRRHVVGGAAGERDHPRRGGSGGADAGDRRRHHGGRRRHGDRLGATRYRVRAGSPGLGRRAGGGRRPDAPRAAVLPRTSVFDEPDDRVDANDPSRRTPESAWPASSLGLPFGADFVNATGNPPAGASAAHRSCVALAAPMEPIALERWLALGGTGRTHDVTVLPAAAGGMDGMELVAPGHGFRLWTDAAGATWLAGRPNLPAGDYQWRLNARDAAGQHEYRTWKFRVTPRAYVSLEGLDIVAGHADLATGAVENPDPNDPTVSLPAADPTTDWADFISSRFDPDSATAADQISFEARGGIGVSLNLAAGATAAASVKGNLVEDRERSGVADVDVLWVGALTPDAVLKVKVEGTSERATGIFNRAAVELYPHLPRTTGQQPVVMPAAPADADGFVTYRDLACGNYYLEMTGVMDEPGHYKLSWMFPG